MTDEALKRHLYYLKNAERIKKRVREYASKNRDKILASKKEYARRNSDRLKIMQAKWRAENKDHIKSYRQSDAGKIARRAAEARRRARINNSSINSDADRFYNLVKSCGRIKCYWCGEYTSKNKMQIDHIFPLAKGGAHSAVNLCVSCPECNSSKRDRHPNEWATQLILI